VRVARRCRLSQAWECGLKCDVAAPAGGGELGLDPRLRSVVVIEPEDRVDGPGRGNELDGADEARPQRGPARKRASPA
jgi:hypothetical protein